MTKEIIIIAFLSVSTLLSGCSSQNNAISNNATSKTITIASTSQEIGIDQSQDQRYQFIKEYNTTITIGGVAGIANKSYQVGDVVDGQVGPGGVRIRIAPHSTKNEGKASSASYQEFITVPIDYLRLDKQINTDVVNKKLLKLNEECGSDLGVCKPGLKCAYPCGIPGCNNVCLPENEQARS